MSKSKINNKKRVKQSGGGRKNYNLRNIIGKSVMVVAPKVVPLFKPIFLFLNSLKNFETKLEFIIRHTSYIINTFGLIAVIYILILCLFAVIIKFVIDILDQPDIANKMATIMGKMMMFGGESGVANFLYILIAFFKCILAMLLIIIFSVTGNKILDSLQTSSPLAALVSTIGGNICYLLGIMGILFSIGLFLGFYNLTCIKDLDVKTYSGNVGDFITPIIGIIVIILASLGFILKQLYSNSDLWAKYLIKAKTKEERIKRMIIFKKTMMFFGLFIFLYLFIKICNHISDTVGDATSKFLLSINMKPSDSTDSTDYGKKCSFEDGLNKGESNFVKTIKSMLTTIFIIFVMIVVVLTSPIDALITKAYGPLLKITCQLNSKAMSQVDPLIMGGPPGPVIDRLVEPQSNLSARSPNPPHRASPEARVAEATVAAWAALGPRRGVAEEWGRR